MNLGGLHRTVVVIGGGQAGLSMSACLRARDVDHVVLEKHQPGHEWRTRRWDSFCLVTPNWSVQLPGGIYDGDDPHGFMPRDEIVAYLERYASGFAAPLREGVEVRRLARLPEGGFVIDTSQGELSARSVVLSTGAYQRPHRPAAASGLPSDLLQMDVTDYANPGDLPPGPLLIVGSGQSGCQIAEELHEAGREVFLSCGRAPWTQRRLGGHDFVWWAVATGFMEDALSSLADPRDRLAANVLATGHGGGRDLNLRTLQARGVTLLGRLLDADGRRAQFAMDLAGSIGWGDERNAQMMGRFERWASEQGLPWPELPAPTPLDTRSREWLDLAGFGAVIFTGGFRPDYASWVEIPGAFDDYGFPLHEECESAAAPALHFAGVHFLRKRKSSLFVGVGEDAGVVARRVARAPMKL